MEPWANRPAEIAHLLNPAFTGAVLRLAVDGYRRESATGMPFSLAFLVLPFSLHKHTVERLPVKVTSHLQQWVQDNRDVLLNFQSRMRTLVPYTREGIIFAGQRQIVTFDENGLLLPGNKKLFKISAFSANGISVPETLKRATFMGRWLALSGSPTSLYSVLGVTP